MQSEVEALKHILQEKESKVTHLVFSSCFVKLFVNKS